MTEILGGVLLLLGGGLMSASSIALARAAKPPAGLPIGELLAAAFPIPACSPASLDALIAQLGAID